MTDILSELFHKVEKKDTDALTPIQKAQRYIQLDISGQSDKAMELAKDGVTAKQIQSTMLKALAGLMKDPKEKIKLSTKAEKVLFALQSDKKEEVEKEILRSGKTVKDVLDDIIRTTLNENPTRQSLKNVILPAIQMGGNPNISAQMNSLAKVENVLAAQAMIIPGNDNMRLS